MFNILKKLCVFRFLILCVLHLKTLRQDRHLLTYHSQLAQGRFGIDLVFSGSFISKTIRVDIILCSVRVLNSIEIFFVWYNCVESTTFKRKRF